VEKPYCFLRSKVKVVALYSQKTLYVGIKDQTVSSRFIQLGILDHYHERKSSIAIQGQWSKVRVIALLRRKIF
jgi:hypothetical protein